MDLNPLEKTGKKHWIQRLRVKYRLVIRDDESLEEKFTFRLTRLNVFVLAGIISIVLIIFTTFLIAFTPLREYIPGYADVHLGKRVYELTLLTDSLEHVIRSNDRYLSNLRRIMLGEFPVDFHPTERDTVINRHLTSAQQRKEADSLLRIEIETNLQQFTQRGTGDRLPRQSTSEIITFFTPLKGIITSPFNPPEGHFGVDIVAKDNEAIKATLDGVVILASWTIDTGYVIALQHQRNYISIYKHNSVLLKKEGDFVRAGDPIAIIGETGYLTTGPHLHFELWFNGNPVNPKDYMTF